MKASLAVLAGGLALVWPALANHYPILFSDTGPLLEMGLLPDMGWDKPWIYGPFLLGLHGRTTLWLPVLAQGLFLSHALWMVQRAFAAATPGRHLLLCAGLAAFTAAPWFASLLLPDMFAPVAVLCIVALGFGAGRLTRWEMGWAAALGTLAIASHLSHLVVAAGCLATLWLVRWRIAWRPGVPLGAALAVLVALNTVGFGIVAVSPYGSVFLLARLIGDGPARELLRRDCPAAGYERLCPWAAQAAPVGWGADSDVFLWHPQSPIWAGGRGPLLFAPEAARVVRATVLAYPTEIAAAMLRNAWTQLWMVRVGDTLGPEHLDVAVLPKLERYFPPTEAARYLAGRQAGGTLADVAAPFAPVHLAALLLGLAGSLAVAARWRRDKDAAGFALVVLASLLANAAVTGALSVPHHRYQARIAWLVVLPPVVALRPRRYAASRATSAGDIRTSAS